MPLRAEVVGRTADGVTVATVFGWGMTQWAQFDSIVSALAGVLVAISAGMSIYLHWKRIRKSITEEDNKE